MCFQLCFPTKEMTSALCVPLIPWIFEGYEMKIPSSMFLVQSWFKKRIHIFWGVTKHFEVLHAIQNLMTNARCMPSGQLTSSWVSSWSILDTRQGTLAEVGSLPVALDVKFSATFSWSSLSMVSVELKFSRTQLGLHHLTFLEMVCFLPKNSVPKRWTWTMSKKIEKHPYSDWWSRRQSGEKK